MEIVGEISLFAAPQRKKKILRVLITASGYAVSAACRVLKAAVAAAKSKINWAGSLVAALRMILMRKGKMAMMGRNFINAFREDVVADVTEVVSVKADM